MPSPLCSSPKLRNATATRQAILCAARKHFARENYENVGLREIAREVGVDASLITRYFGSKEALFKEVLRGGEHQSLFEGIDDTEALAQLFATFAVDGKPEAEDDGLEHDRFLILLHSAASPQASAIVRAALQEDMLGPMSRIIGGKDADARAALAFAVLLGTGVLRTIRGEEGRPPPTPETRARLTALFSNALGET